MCFPINVLYQEKIMPEFGTTTNAAVSKVSDYSLNLFFFTFDFVFMYDRFCLSRARMCSEIRLKERLILRMYHEVILDVHQLYIVLFLDEISQEL